MAQYLEGSRKVTTTSRRIASVKPKFYEGEMILSPGASTPFPEIGTKRLEALA